MPDNVFVFFDKVQTAALTTPRIDTRRSELMAQSVEVLNQKRDIRSYQNIYG
ncbi:MAG: hypothetical protein K5882_12165 [Bacteroidales bacterium]|nr:hypothetical protein [Bacteroidales bacterium]